MSTVTSSSGHHSGPARWWWMMMLPMLASAWVRELWAPDEPRYAEVARTIYQGGDFLVMHLCGDIYPDKPPLLFWLAGFFGWLSGWSELAMRLPSLAATLVTAWLTARIARRWWGEVEAAWAAAMFLTLFMVTELGGRLQIDPLLAVLCIGALELATRPEDDRRRRVWLLLGAGLLLSFGALAKGPVAYINVGLVVLAWQLAGVREDTVRVPRWAWLALVAAAVLPVVAWAVAAALREPQLFEALFFDQHLGRVTKADRHPGPPYKHLYRLIYLLLPWTFLMLAELRQAWFAFRSRRASKLDHGTIRAALWLVALVVFYSLIPPKRDMYLLPAYPAVALLAARALTRMTQAGRLGRWLGLSAPLLLALLGAGLTVAGLRFDQIPGLLWRGPLVGLPLIIGAAVALASRERPQRWATAVAWGWCLFATALALLIMQPMNPLKSGRLLAAELSSLPEQPREIAFIRVRPEAYSFYSKVPGVAVDSLDSHRQREGADFVGLVLEEYWRAMPPEEQQQYRVIMTRQVGGKAIVVLGAAKS